MDQASEKIEVSEEEVSDSRQKESGKQWQDEFTVAANDLIGTIKKLIHETGIRRLVVKNESRHVHLEIPLLMGVGAIALLPVYSALALISALVTDCTIEVIRVETANGPVN